MRRLVIFFIPFVIVSCMSKEPDKTLNLEEMDEVLYDIDSKEEDPEVSYSFESLIEEKFKEFYDLNVLLRDYPNFKEDIETRINNFTTGTRKIFEINDSIKILNIRQKGPLVQVSDSLEMTNVLFDVITESRIKTDSVVAFITKKKLKIDGKEVVSKKVKFTRITIIKV